MNSSLLKPDLPTPVPDSYVGLWQRHSLVDGNGQRDLSSQVFWLQSHTIYIDLRIPWPRLQAGLCRPLVELGLEEHGLLARQEGFAGYLEVQDDICTWHRLLDYQPAAALPDTGQMQFISTDCISETGVMSDYTEEWRRLTPSGSEILVLELVGEEDTAAGFPVRTGYLILLDDHFMYALERRPALPAGYQNLTGILQQESEPPQRAKWLDCEIAYGQWNPGQSDWLVQHCSVPEREGHPAFIRQSLWQQAMPGILVQRDRNARPLRYWRIIETSRHWQAFGLPTPGNA